MFPSVLPRLSTGAGASGADCLPLADISVVEFVLNVSVVVGTLRELCRDGPAPGPVEVLGVTMTVMLVELVESS